MATTVAKENLDERIERIKKRNEEIEKKYREAEEDRLMALKDNAMVEIKPPKDEDWPKAHKYDKIDFTYDVKPEKLEEFKQQRKHEEKAKRDYKKFADGEGPPPDPTYNFLADAERDGLINPKIDNNKNDKKDFRQNNRNNKDGSSNNKRNTANNNSFRGKGPKGHNPKFQKQNSQPEYEQWRSEREKIDEARINRQKIGDGKWRREWDNDKVNAENETLLRPEKITLGDAINVKKSPTHSTKHHNNNNSHHYSSHNMNPSDFMIERRSNITVSVSQTGEVKSVKLTSAPAIGTGRVGPRQVSKPQFSVQTVEKETTSTIQQVPISSPKPLNKEHHKNAVHHHSNSQTQKIPQNNNQNSHQHKPFNVNVANNQKVQLKNSIPMNITQPVLPSSTATVIPNAVTCPPSPIKNKRKSQNSTKFVPASNVIMPVEPPSMVPFVAELPVVDSNGIVPMDLSHKPEFAKKSVQDRLLRVRQPNQINDLQKVNSDQQQQKKQTQQQQQQKEKVLEQQVQQQLQETQEQQKEEQQKPEELKKSNQEQQEPQEKQQQQPEDQKKSNQEQQEQQEPQEKQQQQPEDQKISNQEQQKQQEPQEKQQQQPKDQKISNQEQQKPEELKKSNQEQQEQQEPQEKQQQQPKDQKISNQEQQKQQEPQEKEKENESLQQYALDQKQQQEKKQNSEEQRKQEQQQQEKTVDLNSSLIDKKEDQIEDLETKCDNKTNESIQSIEPIAACN